MQSPTCAIKLRLFDRTVVGFRVALYLCVGCSYPSPTQVSFPADRLHVHSHTLVYILVNGSPSIAVRTRCCSSLGSGINRRIGYICRGGRAGACEEGPANEYKPNRNAEDTTSKHIAPFEERSPAGHTRPISVRERTSEGKTIV